MLNFVTVPKNIKLYLQRLLNYSFIFQLRICVRLHIFYLLQPKQHVTSEKVEGDMEISYFSVITMVIIL